MSGCLVELQYPLRTWLGPYCPWIPEQGSNSLPWTQSDASEKQMSPQLHCHGLSHSSTALSAVTAETPLPLQKGWHSSPREEPALKNGKSTAGADNCHEGLYHSLRTKKTKQMSKAKTWTHCVCTAPGWEANELLLQGKGDRHSWVLADVQGTHRILLSSEL